MRITKATYQKGYKILVQFINQEIPIADFKSFLKKSLHPQIQKFRNKKEFKKVQVDTGFLTWNNGEMEISAESVYNDFCEKNKGPKKSTEIKISPFVKSMATGVKIPINIDYRNEYNQYVEAKYK